MKQKNSNSSKPSNGGNGSKGKQSNDNQNAGSAGPNKSARGKRPPMNPEARKTVTKSSSWTGKLPATLLYEYCQKQKWEKVQFDMVSIFSFLVNSMPGNPTNKCNRDLMIKGLQQLLFFLGETPRRARQKLFACHLHQMFFLLRKQLLRQDTLLLHMLFIELHPIET